jgi:hypothetical protein
MDYKFNGFRCFAGKVMLPIVNPKMHVTGIVTGVNAITIQSFNNVTQAQFNNRITAIVGTLTHRPIAEFQQAIVNYGGGVSWKKNLISSYNIGTQLMVFFYGLNLPNGTVVSFQVYDIWAPTSEDKPIDRISVINTITSYSYSDESGNPLTINIPTTFRGTIEIGNMLQSNTTTSAIILLN